MPTEFAPAERRSRKEILERLDELSCASVLPQILDAIPSICLIVNQERQIVFANKATLHFLGTDDRRSLSGLRPGEALQCIHSSESIDGCGTTEFCTTCGAVNALLASNDGENGVQECRIAVKETGDDLDLQVTASPVEIEGRPYTLFTVNDISSEKRRSVLERVFFHDILNTAGALRGFCELLTRRPAQEAERIKDRIGTLSVRLIEEIEAQKALSDAENRYLKVNPSELCSLDILNDIVATHEEQRYAKGKSVTIDPNSVRINFTSDGVLLKRVLGNLFKNALEASAAGEVVTLSAALKDGQIEFRIHNTETMTKPVQLQVFHRSFSTKGPGRGLGTYSVKLLTERYLKGTIGFSSTPEKGTTFTASYPLDWNNPQK
jgi:signal transduction histidine kinase